MAPSTSTLYDSWVKPWNEMAVAEHEVGGIGARGQVEMGNDAVAGKSFDVHVREGSGDLRCVEVNTPERAIEKVDGLNRGARHACEKVSGLPGDAQAEAAIFAKFKETIVIGRGSKAPIRRTLPDGSYEQTLPDGSIKNGHWGQEWCDSQLNKGKVRGLEHLSQIKLFDRDTGALMATLAPKAHKWEMM